MRTEDFPRDWNYMFVGDRRTLEEEIAAEFDLQERGAISKAIHTGRPEEWQSRMPRLRHLRPNYPRWEEIAIHWQELDWGRIRDLIQYRLVPRPGGPTGGTS